MTLPARADALLAHPFFLANDAKQLERMQPYPPLGTLYAAGHLRERGYRVALFDATFASGPAELDATLDRSEPGFLVLYEDTFHFLNKMCLSHAREAALEMARAAAVRGATVIAAGADVTDHPEAYLGHGIDFALIGEADHTLVSLLDSLSGRTSQELKEIPGLAWSDPQAADGVRRTGPRPPERQPDVFPPPAWDLLDIEPYRRAWQNAHGRFSLNLVSTRGCPFHCNWCAKPIWGQRYAMRSPARVAEEVAELKRRFQPDHLWFADDIFGLRAGWVTEFAQEIEARDARIPFMIQSRVDLMTEKAVAGLARAGCAEVWLGVESGSQKILDAMDKGTRVEQIPVARERLRRAGIRACFFLQFGYPGELFEDIRLTVELVRTLLPDDIGISVTYPLPGTRFHSMVAAQLGAKTHWQESNELAMMFQGTYQTELYRRLHRLLHRDLDLRRKLAAEPQDAGDTSEDRAELRQLEAQWQALEAEAPALRNVEPTSLCQRYEEPPAPDLSRPWN